MLRWGTGLAALAFLIGMASLASAEDTRGTITKIEDDSITVRVGGFGGFGKEKGKAEEKTFKISKSVKIVRVGGKDKEDIKLTAAELKTAIKVTGNVFATITHDDENATEIKIGGRGGFGFGKEKGKKKDGKKPKDDTE